MRKTIKRHSKKKKTKKYYSLCTRCTWKEKLPTMNNENYLMLYGIAAIELNLTIEKFIRKYSENQIKLYENSYYINRIGKNKQNKIDKNLNVMGNELNYLGVIIKKTNCLDVSKIADIIEIKFNEKRIKNNYDEILYITDYCKNNKIDMFRFPVKYRQIDKNLSTMKLIEPASYILVNTDTVLDIAVGKEEILKLYNKYNNQNSLTIKEKSSEALSTERTRKENNSKQVYEIVNEVNKIGQNMSNKADKIKENISSKLKNS